MNSVLGLRTVGIVRFTMISTLVNFPFGDDLSNSIFATWSSNEVSALFVTRVLLENWVLELRLAVRAAH